MKRRAVVVMSLLLGATGCSTLFPGLFPEARPTWVQQGSGLRDGSRGKGFYGVGAAWGIQDAGLRREAAEAAARVDLARALRSSVRNLLQSHASATGRDAFHAAESHLSSTTRTFTEAELVGVPVIERHSDLRTGTEYALVMMTPDAFERHLARTAAGRAETEEIRSRANEAFRRLEAPK